MKQALLEGILHHKRIEQYKDRNVSLLYDYIACTSLD